MHPAALPIDELLRDCEETAARRSGPGGQHRNKVETAVILRHLPTGITAEASERRSRAENRAVAVRRLRMRLAIGHRETPPAGPSALWRGRVRDRRIAVAADHDDLPALVAEALDGIVAAGLSMPAAAASLGVSATQLVRLLGKEPAALLALNRLRAEAGLPALR